MKRPSLLIVLVFFFLFKANAQNVPNGDFENWTNLGFYEEPDFWNTTDSIALALSFGSSHSATKETVDMHGGSFALRLFPFNSPFGTIPGVASNGLLDFNNLMVIGGTPDTIRHQTLNGWYKFSPVSNDSCTIAVKLFKRNGSTQIMVASGAFGTSVPASVYTPFFINLTYATGDSPDTMQVSIFSSALGAAHVGTILLVDDLSFSGVVSGITELSDVVNSLTIYPVPSSTDLTVRLDLKSKLHTTFEISDVNGKKMIVHEMNPAKTLENINIRPLNNGNYFYSLFDDHGNKLAAGKFSVVK